MTKQVIDETKPVVNYEKYVAISSMDQKYYDRCGDQFLATYEAFMKNKLPLYLYNEDDFCPPYTDINLMGWDLGDDYHNFISRHNNNRVKTFAKKAYSIIHAMENIECDKLIWFDADCIFKKPMGNELIQKISPDNCVSTHFSVWHQKNNISYHSCETGFFILNKKHRGFNDFKKIYKDIYNNDKSQDLRRFYDGEVYGKTVKIIESMGYKTNNLNPATSIKTPISRSVIAEYLAHRKAGVKDRLKK